MDPEKKLSEEHAVLDALRRDPESGATPPRPGVRPAEGAERRESPTEHPPAMTRCRSSSLRNEEDMESIERRRTEAARASESALSSPTSDIPPENADLIARLQEHDKSPAEVAALLEGTRLANAGPGPGSMSSGVGVKLSHDEPTRRERDDPDDLDDDDSGEGMEIRRKNSIPDSVTEPEEDDDEGSDPDMSHPGPLVRADDFVNATGVDVLLRCKQNGGEIVRLPSVASAHVEYPLNYRHGALADTCGTVFSHIMWEMKRGNPEVVGLPKPRGTTARAAGILLVTPEVGAVLAAMPNVPWPERAVVASFAEVTLEDDPPARVILFNDLYLCS